MVLVSLYHHFLFRCVFRKPRAQEHIQLQHPQAAPHYSQNGPNIAFSSITQYQNK